MYSSYLNLTSIVLKYTRSPTVEANQMKPLLEVLIFVQIVLLLSTSLCYMHACWFSDIFDATKHKTDCNHFNGQLVITFPFRLNVTVDTPKEVWQIRSSYYIVLLH